MWISELRFQDPRTETYLGSPSITRLPDGALIGTHDYFGAGSPHNMEDEEHLTSVYRSEDNGITWRNITHVSGAYWSTVFVHNGALYLFGASAQYGSMVIRRSDDGGYSWTYPVDESTGLISRGGPYHEPPNYHCAPVPVLVHNGRIYRAFEDNSRIDYGRDFLAVVVSAPVDADLLKAESWTISNKLKFEGAKAQQYSGNPTWLEGNVVAAPDGQLWNVLRFNAGSREDPVFNTAAFVKIDDEGKTLSFDYQTGFRHLPGGATKFTIRHDPKSNLYWTMVNEQQHEPYPLRRNRLSLFTSPDLREWTRRKILLEDNLEAIPEDSIRNTGFQYVDWIFDPAEDDTLLYLVRTAYDGAHNFHDANRITFSRVRNFRHLVKD